MYIAFEGLDGSGKTTQVNIIHKWLMENYYPFARIQEPHDKYLMKAINSVNGYKFFYENEALALLFAADRLLTTDTIQWSFDRNFGVLADRSFLSSLAYQGDTQWIRDINEFVTIPDLIIWLDVDVNVALSRCMEDNPFEKKEKLEEAKKVYDKVYKSGEFNIRRVDANECIEDVTEKIKEILGEFLDDKN